MANTNMFEVERSKLSGREKFLLTRLESEYTEDIARRVLRPLLTQESPISLRALDWAVVNWAKKHNVVCSSSIPGKLTNVHHSYRNTLSFWRRKLFDPFRRRNRITVRIDGEAYETTLGQANFALWTHRSGVLSYVINNIDEIESDMNSISQRQKKERKDAMKKGVRRRRKELTSGPKGMCVAYSAASNIIF